MGNFLNYDHNPKRDIPIVFGFLVAPFVSSCLISGLIAFNLQLGIGPFFGAIPLTFAISAYATFLLGVPLYFLVNKFYKITLASTFASGLTIGGISGAVLSFDVKTISILSVVGGLAGLSFWLVWKQGQKD